MPTHQWIRPAGKSLEFGGRPVDLALAPKGGTLYVKDHRGIVMEGITRSPFWSQTCIFVVEDDPQNGFDHVDGHRSLALVISPYTKRGAVISQFYNQTAVLHTMERILGLPPMNQMDALAPVMSECFTETPNLQPYTCLPNQIPLDEINPPTTSLSGPARYWAQKSRKLPLEKFDQADEDTLNRILCYTLDIPWRALARSRGLPARPSLFLPLTPLPPFRPEIPNPHQKRKFPSSPAAAPIFPRQDPPPRGPDPPFRAQIPSHSPSCPPSNLPDSLL